MLRELYNKKMLLEILLKNTVKIKRTILKELF